MSKGKAPPIRKFLNQPISFESNRNGRFEIESRSFTGPYLMFTAVACCASIILEASDLFVTLYRCC